MSDAALRTAADLGPHLLATHVTVNIHRYHILMLCVYILYISVNAKKREINEVLCFTKKKKNDAVCNRFIEYIKQ